MTLTESINTELKIGSVIHSPSFAYGRFELGCHNNDVNVNYSHVVVGSLFHHPPMLVRRESCGFEEVKYDTFDVDAYDPTRAKKLYMVQSISPNYVVAKRMRFDDEINDKKDLCETLSIYWPYVSHNVRIQQVVVPIVGVDNKKKIEGENNERIQK